jgi:hypothetical protein
MRNCPVQHGAIGLVFLAGGADGIVQLRPLLGFVFGFMKVADYAELAQLAHVTRARMTQIMNLLHLAPDIQE